MRSALVLLNRLPLPRGQRRCRRSCGCGHPLGLGRDEVLELTPIQEDASALGALVDMDAVALEGAHGTVALGADEIAHAEILRHGRDSSNSVARDRRTL